jgi:hypothetical protein
VMLQNIIFFKKNWCRKQLDTKSKIIAVHVTMHSSCDVHRKPGNRPVSGSPVSSSMEQTLFPVRFSFDRLNGISRFPYGGGKPLIGDVLFADDLRPSFHMRRVYFFDFEVFPDDVVDMCFTHAARHPGNGNSELHHLDPSSPLLFSSAIFSSSFAA